MVGLLPVAELCLPASRYRLDAGKSSLHRGVRSHGCRATPNLVLVLLCLGLVTYGFSVREKPVHWSLHCITVVLHRLPRGLFSFCVLWPRLMCISAIVDCLLCCSRDSWRFLLYWQCLCSTMVLLYLYVPAPRIPRDWLTLLVRLECRSIVSSRDSRVALWHGHLELQHS